jgi:amidase
VTATPHDDIAFRSAEQLLADLESRRLSSVELASALTERIGTLDRPSDGTGLHSVIDLLPDAVADAEECDRERAVGVSRGPLHGIPVMVKDNIEVRGGRATAGSLALAGSPLEVDAPLVARLRAAGAIVLATANLSEWANIRSGNSSSGWSAVGGLCVNPWDRTRSAGGSSSGSGVAVAAGFVPFAVGTETDGSITCPASLNGVVGIKPTVGSVPTRGVVPISSSQDVPGPLARSLDDASMMLAVLSGDLDLTRRIHSVETSSLRIGFIDRWCTGDDRADRLAADALLAVSGCFAEFTRTDVSETTEDVQMDEFTVLLSELSSELDDYLATRPGCAVRSLADVVEFNRRHADRELAYFGQEFFEQSVQSGGKSSSEYRDARRRNVDWANTLFSTLWESFDVVVAPAYAPAWTTDFTKGHAEARGGAVSTPAAIAGLPIVTIPCGLVDGLPVGVSFVGPAHSEARLIATARVVEASLGLAGDRSFRPPAFRVGP